MKTYRKHIKTYRKHMKTYRTPALLEPPFWRPETMREVSSPGGPWPHLLKSPLKGPRGPLKGPRGPLKGPRALGPDISPTRPATPAGGCQA